VPVDTLGLTPQERRFVVRACGSVRVDTFPADFLRRFIAAMVEVDSPELAIKILNFNETKMGDLHEELKALQKRLA
jgi:hypothetical protein